jgi:anti-anti-sigma factor
MTSHVQTDYSARDFIMRQYDGVTVVRFTTGHLVGGQDLDRVTAEVQGLIEAGARQLVLDFKHVRYINSATLSMLLAVHGKLTNLGGRLVLSHPENIAELLKISRMEKLFPTAENPKVAVAMLASGGSRDDAKARR